MSLPRHRLATLPTPLVRAEGLERMLEGGPIYLKREDLTGFGVAGNKARALEFLVGDALAHDADVLVTTGSRSSNFCAAAAMAASVAGLECQLLLAGPEPTDGSVTIGLARAAGSRLHFLPGTPREQLDQVLLGHADALRAQGRRPYAMPRGGATAVGATGYACAVIEMAAQCEEAGITLRTVVLATGSGCTQAGLVAGQVGLGLPWRIVGASVSRPPHDARSGVLDLARRCAERLGLEARASPEDVNVEDLRGPGFGLPSDDDRASAEIALRHAGILLDHHYGAKALTLLRRLLADDAATPVVFLHTGGLPAALDALTEGGAE